MVVVLFLLAFFFVRLDADLKKESAARKAALDKAIRRREVRRRFRGVRPGRFTRRIK